MSKILLRFLTLTLILLITLLPFDPAFAAASSDGGVGTASENAIAPTVTRLPAIAIGARHPKEKRLVRPREEVVERSLRKQRKILPGMTPDQVQSAVKAYYYDFYKENSVRISPATQARVQQRWSSALENASTTTAQTTSASSTSKAVQPVTAKVLGLTVEFGGNDTFVYSALSGDAYKSQKVTTKGPLKGQIPRPGASDNNSIWYDPAKSAKASFYERLIFGYQGVGRVRYDLRDPTDHRPGINLNGYTVQDYYDHMAGSGNVELSGAVKGWVTVNHSEGYYTKGPSSTPQLVVDALNKFMKAHPDYYNDNSTNAFWKQFDANNDGIVDSFWLIHAGMGLEEGGGAQGDFAIWSYSGRLYGFKVYEGDPNTTDDDISIDHYVVLPEDVGLGVLVEEFGHNFFELPDLYTNDIENSIGFWSIMSAGTWGGWLGGTAPVGMPLYFRMIAQCGDQLCNWQEPLLELPYNATTRSVTIGQLESTPTGAYKGVKVNLPDYVDKTGSYSSYYLVEWRSNTKYDKMLKTAYVTTYSDADEWAVQRIPYNIPGAVIYYFNEKYPFSYALEDRMSAPPSIGPKYPLLVVDMNYDPLRLGDTGIVLDARKGSYDAALTLQATKPFTLTQIYRGGTIITGPWDFASKPAVRIFDDSQGYFAGFYAGSPCDEGAVCSASDNGSTVIPALDSYSTRITHYDGTPYTEFYGQAYGDSILGSGNPGDEGLQYGVRIKLQRKSRTSDTATLLFNSH
jgi:M6 family metalloprotease-like protein